MNEIIAALQEEIALAEENYYKLTRKRATYPYGEERRLAGYIDGLQTVLSLLTKTHAQELPY